MRRLTSAFCFISGVVLFAGHCYAFDPAPFGTGLTLTDMAEEWVRFDTSTGYEGTAQVDGNTARVTVQLNYGDDWDFPPPPVTPPPVGVALGPDTGGRPIQALWNTGPFDWSCIAETPVKVSVLYSYDIQNPEWGSIGAQIQIGDSFFQHVLDQYGTAAVSAGSSLLATAIVPFDRLFVSGQLHVSGPKNMTWESLEYEGEVTIHSVSFDFPEGPACCQTIEDLISSVGRAYFDAGIKNSLLSKLESAKNSLSNGMPSPAVNKLGAFINEVEAQYGEKVSPKAADYMIKCATKLIASL